MSDAAGMPSRSRNCIFPSLQEGMNKEQATELLSKYDNSTPLFSLAGMKTWCRIVEAFDANTLKVVFPFQNKDDVHKIIVRVMGIDSPEMKSKDPVVKEWAVKARNRMLLLLAPGVFEVDGSYSRKDIIQLLKANVTVIWLHVLERDKFGRMLGNLFYAPKDTRTIQSICVDEGFCKEYKGKTKSQWVPNNCKRSFET
jgi:endonuclease YncB( thermonuclease family)